MKIDKLLLTYDEVQALALESVDHFGYDPELLKAQVSKIKSQIEEIPDPAQDYIDDWLKGWRSCKKDILRKFQEPE